MQNLALASPRLPVLVGAPAASARRRPSSPSLPAPLPGSRWRTGSGRRARLFASALNLGGSSGTSGSSSNNVFERFKDQRFASMSSSSSGEVTTGSATALPVPPPPSYIGSPLFWIGVGVALSALFSMVVTRLKKYALQQAFKTMMDQAAPTSSQYNNSTFPAGSPFPFSTAPQTTPSSFSPSPLKQDNSKPVVTVEVPASKIETVTNPETIHEAEARKDSNKYAFVDISPEELLQKEREFSQESAKETVDSDIEVSPNGAAFKPKDAASTEQSQTRQTAPLLSVDALEKMMDDPTVQKMVYPYLPEEMRNPTTFKWMLQNPQYRQQLQDMLNNMGGSPELDNRMMESLKNFDLSSPEVKQQFEQIGLTPEEVISRIMANPDVAVAFQNPKIQAAIMDCSQNPLNIGKYQNDKEVMDVFTKISELFPGMTR